MTTPLQKVAERYLAHTRRSTTASGIPVKPIYHPEDVKDLDYEKDLGEPGEFPFTRGTYADMYRGRLFSMRLITGCPTPKLTNERFGMLLTEGESAINIIGDQPTMMCFDVDHPRAEGGVGLTGCPICTPNDMATVLDGLPLDQLSVMLSLGTPIALPSLLVTAEKRGVPFEKLRGTNPIMGPGVCPNVCNYGGGLDYYDAHIMKSEAFFKTMEWMAEHTPRINAANYNSYNIREWGVNAAQEIGFLLAQVFESFKMAEECGADKETFARKISFTCSVMIDIFEEVAKFRAARRIYARTLKERFKIDNPKCYRMKIHVNTGGSLMEGPQAKVNIVRGAYAALAAALGGIQSMQIASYDEPIAIPTDESATMALRTEQVLAHETNISSVVDPLAGSYYMESLTDQMEAEIQKIIDDIESRGGMTHCVRTGWIEQEMEKEALRRQEELETKQRVVVGVNEYIVPPEEDEVVAAYEIDRKAVEAYVKEVREFKKNRHTQPLKEALESLRRIREEGKETPIPYLMECCRAGATTGEVFGIYRMSAGLSYDQWGQLEYPF
jgi:methylmalonyl-CoA mutase N-terminal domain/subunit